MRYPDGGGLTAAGRARREKVRLQAAQLFEQDMPPVQVAHQLRVSTKSAYQDNLNSHVSALMRASIEAHEQR
jgi:hypothetical protein